MMLRLALLSIAALLQTAGLAWPEAWRPIPGTSFEWILQNYAGAVPAQKVIDLDLFDTPTNQIANLRFHRKKVICYVSVGSWENWRPDADEYPDFVKGRPLDGWPGERWLDIRQIDRLSPIIGARLNRCKAKGFHALEPDNLDGFQTNTGFPITRADALRYIRWLARQAHQRGLSIGLKNVPELISNVLDEVDWALTEDCFDQGWCNQLRPFITAGKAVFAVEYTDTGINFSAFCDKAKQLGLSPLLKRRNLGPWSRQCPG